AWLALVRSSDLRRAPAVSAASPVPGGLWKVVFSRRMFVVLIVVALINTSWQTLRAWLPKFLQEGRGYAESEALYFNALFYVATDVGVIGAGAVTLWLHRRGRTVHGARLAGFLVCAVLGTATAAIPFLDRGGALLAVLLLAGAGVLGVFPIYHALTQDLSPHHQGKITGIASVAAWAVAPPAQKFFGRLVDRTGSFDLGFALAGWLPLLAFAALWLFWERRTSHLST
ncbi:MAG TPA: MFS transporter, partial [Methylomirabilota bacterium]|nr:MFS transporter [Methylomirabilota bacterium]